MYKPNRHNVWLCCFLFQKTFEKLGQEVKEGAANWEMMTNRYFDIVEQHDILSKADEFLSKVRFETTLLPLLE